MYVLSFDILNTQGYRETLHYLIDKENRKKIIDNYVWLRFTNVDGVYVELPRSRVIALNITPYVPDDIIKKAGSSTQEYDPSTTASAEDQKGG